MQAKAQLAQNQIESRNMENQWPGYVNGVNGFPSYASYMNPISPQSSLESVDHNNAGMNHTQELQSCRSEEYFSFQQACSKKRPNNNTTDLGELQALALRMMRN